MKTVTYNQDTVTFKSIGHKWEFSFTGGSVIVACKGKAAAFRVASAVAGGLKRTMGNGIDGLTRASINRILAPAVQD